MPEYPEALNQTSRLIIHQFDPARASPGGIDTCLRGICRYAPSHEAIAIVGVDTGAGGVHRKLGRWETHQFGDRTVHFLPVTKLDPADQMRRIPHSLRLVAGALKYRRMIPKTPLVQAHRMDTGISALLLARRPLCYFIHTQENGLTGKTSDSLWRSLAPVHRRLERYVVGRASDVVVFNETYSQQVREWNPKARFSPTWFDPALVKVSSGGGEFALCWVGRLEQPKDPILAIRVLEHLNEIDPSNRWSLNLIGSGTLADKVQEYVDALPARVAACVRVHGRLDPSRVSELMSASKVFLMTSHAGYEGFPRVLVEAMASGLPAVVTEGSDTGGLVFADQTGFVCSRAPEDLAAAVLRAQLLDPDKVRESVESLGAPRIVERIMVREK